MKRPKRWPYEIARPMTVFARQLGMTLDEYLAIAYREKDPPPNWEESFAAAFEPLLSHAENSTIRTMRAEIREPRIGRPLKAGKLAAALVKADVTLVEIAEAAKRSTASVRSWAYPKGHDSHRPAPRDVVEMFLERFHIPLSVWPEITG